MELRAGRWLKEKAGAAAFWCQLWCRAWWWWCTHRSCYCISVASTLVQPPPMLHCIVSAFGRVSWPTVWPQEADNHRKVAKDGCCWCLKSGEAHCDS